MLLGMNIQSGSKEALAVVPVITFFVALWLLAFYLMHAGKLVNYIRKVINAEVHSNFGVLQESIKNIKNINKIKILI